ncbi:interleukin-18 receptor 1-like [Leucoraja erinacea]|uniref:interleukin-18 receptor 1-like n=1 Tax=Leucoraja erinaceus TaxID=7782 RepID=UPI002457C629|nr:interleukin-18 receptor 1-like [Leucoraja erinacea]
MDLKYLALLAFYYVVGRIQGGVIGKCSPDKYEAVVITEGEHARIKCNLCKASTLLAMSYFHTHGFNITWFKYIPEGGQEKLSGETARITYDDISLGFWPALLNDTGKYFCSVFNGTYNISSASTYLNVHKMEGLCDDHFYKYIGIVGRFFSLLCPNLEDYNSEKNNVTWLKDRKDKVHTGNTYTIQKVEETNAGCYLCVLTLENGGVQYNVSRRVKLHIEHIEPFIPKIVYPGKEEKIEVELGDKREIECKAVLGYKDNDCMLYWKSECDYFGIDANETDTRSITENNRVYLINQLVFKRIKTEHLNRAFHCCLLCPETEMVCNVILLEKDKHVTGRLCVLLFTTLALIIIVAVIYVRFKIYFALCIRDFTCKDETLQDSKEYDAYVLLLKSNEALICAEGEYFALKLLPAILEQKFGYRLCIFERDVLPGAAFADDIFSYINKSRTLIIILCAELLENESSMYGLMSGLHQVLVERLIKPILIEYNPIRDITFLPQSLQLILKSNRTVKWTNESLLQNSYFWKRIRYLMPAKCIKRTQFY